MTESEFPIEEIEETESNKPSILTILLLLLMIAAMLLTILWPLIRHTQIQRALPPTPTPPLFQAAVELFVSCQLQIIW